eukprot:XP_011674774.1 PREDICTED: uncharacterized protein LOC105443390 [Strongylocentrotus purpuratus]
MNYFGVDISATFYASCIVAFVIAITNSFFTLRNYRNNTRSLWKGNLPLTNIQQRPPKVVLSALEFSGYTIAFLISGFIVLQVMLWAIFIGLEFLLQNDSVGELTGCADSRERRGETLDVFWG